MIAPPYLYEVSSARAPEGFHSVKEEPQRKDFQVDFPFENLLLISGKNQIY